MVQYIAIRLKQWITTTERITGCVYARDTREQPAVPVRKSPLGYSFLSAWADNHFFLSAWVMDSLYLAEQKLDSCYHMWGTRLVTELPPLSLSVNYSMVHTQPCVDSIVLEYYCAYDTKSCLFTWRYLLAVTFSLVSLSSTMFYVDSFRLFLCLNSIIAHGTSHVKLVLS